MSGVQGEVQLIEYCPADYAKVRTADSLLESTDFGQFLNRVFTNNERLRLLDRIVDIVTEFSDATVERPTGVWNSILHFALMEILNDAQKEEHIGRCQELRQRMATSAVEGPYLEADMVLSIEIDSLARGIGYLPDDYDEIDRNELE